MVEGGTARLRNDHEDQLVSLGGAPASVYKGSREGAGRPGEARQEESYSLRE